MSANVTDNPPSSVLLTAIAPPLSSQSIVLPNRVLSGEVPVYINTYFSEVSQLDSTENRSFAIFVDNERISDPIVPPYHDAVEKTFNITVSASTNISLEATSDSTLPPLINAMEIFQVGDALTDGTDGKDGGSQILDIEFYFFGYKQNVHHHKSKCYISVYAN